MKRSSISKFINLRFVLGLLVCAACAIAGCQSDIGNGQSLASQAAPPTRVTLTAGDTVRLTFSGAPELNQAQKIRADGKLSLPLIGEMDAAGKTVAALQGDLTQAYKSQLKNSEVLVTLENAPATVVISGAVAKPDRIEFDKPTTVLQAIMQAGGATPFGNMKAVRLIRTVRGVQQSQVLDLTPILRGEATKPFYVRDGDVIFVPQSLF
ncbi:MAG: polysaccharide biosynthesis/export family protein [Verrucomicrobia bacterium]|nr:polysaccharide biosynthesis/export family protein [Verrucomicrobiota bacterium]